MLRFLPSLCAAMRFDVRNFCYFLEIQLRVCRLAPNINYTYCDPPPARQDELQASILCQLWFRHIGIHFCDMILLELLVPSNNASYRLLFCFVMCFCHKSGSTRNIAPFPSLCTPICFDDKIPASFTKFYSDCDIHHTNLGGFLFNTTSTVCKVRS